MLFTLNSTNYNKVVNCPSNENGLALVPDFLCKEAIAKNEIRLVWEGTYPTENTLYFASRSDLKYKKELGILTDLCIAKMKTLI